MTDIPPPDRPRNEMALELRLAYKAKGGEASNLAEAVERILEPVEKRTMLVLATSHLPSEAFLRNLNGWEGVHAVQHDNGVFMWVPDDPQESADVLQGECVPEPHDPGCDDCSVHGHLPSVPPLLLDIQKFARTVAGADWVNFDSDGPEILDLPAWRW